MIEISTGWVYFLGFVGMVGLFSYLTWKEEIDSMLSDLWNKS